MLCYKDKTFCSFYKECKVGKKCHRALTDEVLEKANGNNMLISQYMDKPSCFKVNKGK